MNYSIASGDCLWNIAKNNYNCTSNKEIQDVVNLIVKENNIKNPNLIYAGATLALPETDLFKKQEPEEPTRADKFDEWTNSSENYEMSLNAMGDEDAPQVEDFQMFELNLSTYSSDLKEFSQEYIDKFDADGDGQWNLDEFKTMAAGGISEEEYALLSDDSKAEMDALYEQLFAGLNLDDDKETITAKEFAAYLYASDLDWDNYIATGFDVASSIDGKINYDNYQSLSSLDPESDAFSTLQRHKQYFYDAYYAA